MAEWITKKELLQETGISYGQLYRWKRKGLIPETWFVRRSTFTGQETFFPRAAILERIEWIQGMKPDIPLDDLASWIREPQESPDRLPLDVLLATLDETPKEAVGSLRASIPGRLVTRVEFLGELASRTLTAKGAPDTLGQALDEFLAGVPIDWLEYPGSLLLIDRPGGQAKGRFFIVQSRETIWWGQSPPGYQIPLNDFWNQVKTGWAKVKALSEGAGKFELADSKKNTGGQENG